MSIPRSGAADLALPRWAYVPGESAEAEADHDTLWHAKALVPPRFAGFVPARHPALRYGIALNDAGYFWESQEILQAVWAAAARLLAEALSELDALGARRTTADGLADGFPTAALAALVRSKLTQSLLS